MNRYSQSEIDQMRLEAELDAMPDDEFERMFGHETDQHDEPWMEAFEEDPRMRRTRPRKTDWR